MKTYASRKLVFAAGLCILIFLGACVAAKWVAFAALYATMIGGMIAIYAAYAGANLTEVHLETTKAVKLGGTTKPKPKKADVDAEIDAHQGE